MIRRFDKILAELLSSAGINPAGDSLLLAVSGGADSMCMTKLFCESSLGVKFSIAHCNFHLRDKESDGDEQYVLSWAENQGIEVFKKDFDTMAYAEEHSISIEMAARDLRYAWFADLCRRHGFKAVVVAHNANDNAETLILNILRGTGGKGLSGIREISYWQPDEVLDNEKRVCVLRPLLQFTRESIELFCSVKGIHYHNDSTNAMTEYKRNKIRHLVFPVFEEINPSFLETISREVRYFSQQNDIADEYFETMRPDLIHKDVSGAEEVSIIDIQKLTSSSSWEYLLYRLLSPFGFMSGLIESVENLLKSERTISGKVFESDEYELITTSQELLIRQKKSFKTIDPLKKLDCLKENLQLKINEAENFLVVRTSGTYELEGTRFKVDVQNWEKGMSPIARKGEIKLDLESLSFPFIIRKWENGDWMRPLGMKGRRKKVSDIFTDLKFNVLDKEKALMLVAPGLEEHHISGILALRIDEDMKISSSTKKIISITIQ